jgi:hypothetical protein
MASHNSIGWKLSPDIPLYFSHDKSCPMHTFFGKSVRTRLDLLHPDISHNVESNQALQKQQYDRHAHECEFNEAREKLLTRACLDTRDSFQTCGISDFSVRVNWKRHMDQVKKLGTDERSTEFESGENIESGFLNITVISPTSENTTATQSILQSQDTGLPVSDLL